MAIPALMLLCVLELAPAVPPLAGALADGLFALTLAAFVAALIVAALCVPGTAAARRHVAGAQR